MLMEAKCFIVCVLFLDSHKKCFLLHTGLGHQITRGQREESTAGSHRKKDEDCGMGRFYVLFPKMLYFM